MNLTQIETNIQQLLASFSKDTFIYDLLLAYGVPKASISRLQKGGLNLSKVEGEIVWKKKLFFKAIDHTELQELMDGIKGNGVATKIDPRFIVVTNYDTLLGYDRKTGDTLDVAVMELAKHFDFFLPWAGMEKAQAHTENTADVKAAERMAKLYDEITKDNPTHTDEEVHSLNVFLSRLLFCFFAEDTDIFEKNQFTKSISSHTQADGSDLQSYLERVFEVMNTDPKDRVGLPAFLDGFPYVNGGLFRTKHSIPTFTRRSRQAIIESGSLGWAEINPDIFGSMIQAVITPEHRGGLGMHYTSVPNIMKVIEPLFLNDLYEEFEAAKGSIKKLTALLVRLWKIKLFDPACGSGNFLIIAYKELRRLEMKIFKEIDLVNKFHSNQYSGISLANFYGIELDDFAHEIATLSLWLAEHQMNREFFAAFGRTKPALPLKETGNIVHGNACRLDWEQVCPNKEGDEIYIMGNPPYIGFQNQNEGQKEDIIYVFKDNINFRRVDYIGCWLIVASNYIKGKNCSFAFVSTNSICQGEQVYILWPQILSRNLNIFFAHTSFNWGNSAKNEAKVTCVIVGVKNNSQIKRKIIYTLDKVISVSNINPYLIEGSTVFLKARSEPISKLNKMSIGNVPLDGNNFILSEKEVQIQSLLTPEIQPFIRKYMGSSDFINCNPRYCIWITDETKDFALKIPFIADRVEKCKAFRLTGGIVARQHAHVAYRFRTQPHLETNSIIFPKTSSSRREYVPAGFLDKTTIISEKALAAYNAEPYLFSILSSKIHILWLSITSSRMRNDYQYSISLTYNTFPFPSISVSQKQELEVHVYRILEEREKDCEKTLAQLYDPDKMPEGLREAHRQNDLAVERCYRSKPFESDEERLEYLFKLYEQMIEDEKNGGTLFAGDKKPRKKK